jgi:hypothetical protein
MERVCKDDLCLIVLQLLGEVILCHNEHVLQLRLSAGIEAANLAKDICQATGCK